MRMPMDYAYAYYAYAYYAYDQSHPSYPSRNHRTFGAIGTLTLTRSRTRTPIVPVPITPTTIAMLPIQAVTIVRLEQLVP